MKIVPNFSEIELNGLKQIEAVFIGKVDKVYVVTKNRTVGGGYDYYTSIRFHICFKEGIELSRSDYATIDALFPISEENGYLISAYEYNPYDISKNEEVKVWQVSN